MMRHRKAKAFFFTAALVPLSVVFLCFLTVDFNRAELGADVVWTADSIQNFLASGEMQNAHEAMTQQRRQLMVYLPGANEKSP